MDNQNQEVKPETLVRMYTAIDSSARRLASQHDLNDLVISQDRNIKSRFYIRVSNMMAPYLLKAIQEQADSLQGVSIKSYFYKLQEEIMSQTWGTLEQSFNIRYEGRLF